ncbi:ImmA/IrrE family metallo-endopeptidase [Alienimonas californiensis]|uniref:ImmA/IrrE family metallo-endopeptidase n=1 Tax=Alienimonas californiensis TaxID=2527989 RepID=UPI001F615690|nr:ImmA/IrrE family metallo-endopeptidase [Alienimonas californiensis]
MADEIRFDDDTTPAVAATKVRELLGLGTGPIYNLVAVLADAGISSVELETSLGIDGAAGVVNGHPFMFVALDRPADRVRLTCAHEVGHIVFGDCDDGRVPSEEGPTEDRAFDFGSHLILPHERLVEAFRGRSFLKLVKTKEEFGISVSAMIYRAREAGEISETLAARLWKDMARRGWRRDEPGNVRWERADELESHIEVLLHESGWDWEQIEHAAGIPREQLQIRLDRAMRRSGFGGPPTGSEEDYLEGDEERSGVIPFRSQPDR